MFGKKHHYDIFLGGTNESTWRDTFIKRLGEVNPRIKYFNPVVENWTQECIELENFVKDNTNYHVYVITPKQLGFYSIAEMVESTHMKNVKTFFFIKEEDVDENGTTIEWNPRVRNSLAAVSNLLISNGAIKAIAMDDLVFKISRDFDGTPKPRELNRSNRVVILP